MTTVARTRQLMAQEPQHWVVPLMDFVDDLRRTRDPAALAEPFVPAEPRLDALLAAVVEHLCKELGLTPPPWVGRVPPAPEAWFVSGLNSLRAIALAESPLAFRLRRIFVLRNFLDRV
jgi:hypothetical protein